MLDASAVRKSAAVNFPYLRREGFIAASERTSEGEPKGRAARLRFRLRSESKETRKKDKEIIFSAEQ